MHLFMNKIQFIFLGLFYLSEYVCSMVADGIIRKRCSTSCRSVSQRLAWEMHLSGGCCENPLPLAQSDRGRRIKAAAGVLARFKAQKLSSRVSESSESLQTCAGTLRVCWPLIADPQPAVYCLLYPIQRHATLMSSFNLTYISPEWRGPLCPSFSDVVWI